MATNRTWDDVEVGERLPELVFPVSWRTLMAELVATRDFMPYHYHPDFAKQLGMRGAFVNTTFNQALFGRFVTDWTGPDSDIRSATLQMLDQTVPGDVLHVNGVVTGKREAGGDALVEIALEFTHALGVAARSTTVVAMPSAALGAVTVGTLEPLATVEHDTGMPEMARVKLGEVDTRHGPYPVDETQIMYLAEMTHDANPLYEDGEYARASRHGGMIAPLTSLLVWSQYRNSQIGIDPDFPDPDLPEQPAWPSAAKKAGMITFRLPSTTDVIVQQVLMEYAGGLHRGDRVRVTSELVNCSALKRTRRGLGYFVTFVDTFFDQSDVLIGRCTLTQLQYGVPDDTAGVA